MVEMEVRDEGEGREEWKKPERERQKKKKKDRKEEGREGAKAHSLISLLHVPARKWCVVAGRCQRGRAARVDARQPLSCSTRRPAALSEGGGRNAAPRRSHPRSLALCVCGDRREGGRGGGREGGREGQRYWRLSFRLAPPVGQRPF